MNKLSVKEVERRKHALEARGDSGTDEHQALSQLAASMREKQALRNGATMTELELARTINQHNVRIAEKNMAMILAENERLRRGLEEIARASQVEGVGVWYLGKVARDELSFPALICPCGKLVPQTAVPAAEAWCSPECYERRNG